MRGVAFVAAVTVVAEVGDFTRFANPRQLMAYLGLTPSEHSSGTTVRRGGITKAGNALARRALIEGAWTYRMQARVSRKLHDRIEGLAADRPRHRLEGAGQALRPLSSARGGRQAQGRRHHRHRPRDGRLSLGDCSPNASRLPRLTLRRRNISAPTAGGGARWGTLAPVMSRLCRRSPSRPRQLQDETTVMR